jgi:hypothetical protein
MKANNRFSIDFIIRLRKNEKTKALLYARVTVNKECTEISLKEQIDPACWDNAREEVKGQTVAAKALNRHIEEVRFKIREKYRPLSDKEAIITAEAVKLAYLGNHSIQRTGHTLRELIALHTKIQFPKLRPGTSKNYGTTEKHTSPLFFIADNTIRSNSENLFLMIFIGRKCRSITPKMLYVERND